MSLPGLGRQLGAVVLKIWRQICLIRGKGAKMHIWRDILETLLSSLHCRREAGHLLECGAAVGPGALHSLGHPLRLHLPHLWCQGRLGGAILSKKHFFLKWEWFLGSSCKLNMCAANVANVVANVKRLTDLEHKKKKNRIVWPVFGYLSSLTIWNL